MCTLAAVQVGAIVIQAATATYASVEAGEANKKRARFEASVARRNAMLAEKSAQDAWRRGREQANALRRKHARLRGLGITRFAAGNVLLGAGTSLDWEDESQAIEAQDLARVDYNANIAAWAARTQAAGFQQQAAFTDRTAASAQTVGYIQAGGSLLAGAGRVAAVDFGPPITTTDTIVPGSIGSDLANFQEPGRVGGFVSSTNTGSDFATIK